MSRPDEEATFTVGDAVTLALLDEKLDSVLAGQKTVLLNQELQGRAIEAIRTESTENKRRIGRLERIGIPIVLSALLLGAIIGRVIPASAIKKLLILFPL